MSAHNVLQEINAAEVRTISSTTAETLKVTKWNHMFLLVSAGAETRTLPAPIKAGQRVVIAMKTDGGDVTVTVTGGFNEDGDTTFVFSDPGQFAIFEAMEIATAGTLAWRKVSDYGLGNIAPADSAVLSILSGLTATADEINRSSKNSTRPVAAGGANLTVTQALHDGKTILLDQATGTAVTLPAMTGSGARYRFVCSVATSGGSQVITATGAHLFGGVAQNTDTAAGTLFTANIAANASGSTTITLNGGTTGGRKGDWIEIEDVATSIGMVRGILNGSGTEATPFS